MSGADDQHSDVTVEEITLDVRGESCPSFVVRPTGPGPHPAVVIGQEATGPNVFIRRVAQNLAGMGYVSTVPDYYRGQGPPDPEAYDDLPTLMAYMDALDFRRGAYDLMAALDAVKSRPDVDDQRVGLWAYCTGATLALLTACLRTDVAASVLFYPSQPRFEVTDARRPMHAIDLVWNITSPVLLLIGEEDPVWPPELIEEMRGRLTQWGVDHAIKTYPGAGHAFCAPAPMFHDAGAEQAAWSDGVAYLAERLR